MKLAWWPILLLVIACDSCKRGGGDALPSASGSASATPSAPPGVVREIVSAEQARSTRSIPAELLSSRDVSVRRRAARALARIADAPAAELLSAALADEDAAVVTWAAYGLGYACKGREPATVRALVSRAASLSAAQAEHDRQTGGLWGPIASIADALARCATSEAEQTLRAWLDGPRPRAEAAALALGRLATRTQRLDDASIVSLLDAASRPEDPLEGALLAFSRLGGLSEPVQERLLGVAKEALAARGQRRVFAVRTLGRAGAEAAPVLLGIVTDAKADAVLRATAARELPRLGDAGQRALGEALAALAPKKEALSKLVAPEWLPLAATLDGLSAAPKEQRALLEELAELPLPEKATPALRRRIVEIRCRAAALLAGTASLYPKLVQCDPDVDGRTGRLAVLRVLGRGDLEGTRHRRWLELTKVEDQVVRQTALELLSSHAETPRAWEPIAAALGAKSPGTVAVAARVLADHPDRAAEKAGAPEPSVIEALTKAFAAKWPRDAVETRAALIDAAGALQLLSLKPKVAEHCDGDSPTLRQAAEKALRLMGERTRECKASKAGSVPKSLGLDLPREVKLVFETDVGELALTLDSELAPVTTARIVELARSGFYDGIVMHRVVPGFVVQFGDPGGDGYGGSGREPLRCETSPMSFREGSVGIALAGRDTGSSQLFVTLADYPHLDGSYPQVGRADPGWDRVAQGDAITKVRVVDAPKSD